MSRTIPDEALPASFRDPAGFLFRRDGRLRRQVNPCYRDDYNRLIESGLYETLSADGKLIAHEEVAEPSFDGTDADRILAPEQIAFISYPYEWCFGQWKAAALLTLEIQQRAMACDMSLKDCSAYNVQFRGHRPIFIDTLSFERYREGEAWVAYRQFCQHFLAPLALMSWCDVRLGQFVELYIDGLPLDLTSRLLPWRSRLRLGLLAHLHLHARAQRRYANARRKVATRRVSKFQLTALIENLKSTVMGLRYQHAESTWGRYYEETNYTTAAFQTKERLVGEFVEAIQPRTTWDLGANTGHFSRLVAQHGGEVIAFDFDRDAVERNYQQCVRERESSILPLVLDLTNPSPGLGWQNLERDSLLARSGVDLVMALALIHHLVISNNVPLEKVAQLLHRLGRHLIIEFIPKCDSQVQRLLVTREDIFPDYTRQGFESAFSSLFVLQRIAELEGSERVLYWMTSKAPDAV
ncbi:MAG: class I SAM-dependent methyltransferase [Pirellulales bacterium]|nr:class I SAM-dependent methyltransferase [Pirellulales bacterium]